MKTILMVTDFSAASHNACRYGWDLAGCFGASVHLFNAYQAITGSAFDAPIYESAEEVRKAACEQLLDEARSLNAEQFPSFFIDCAEGPATPAILEKAKEIKADLIVAGMKSEHKTFRKLIGSVVTDLAKRSSIPLLVVPSGARFMRLENIALAVDADVAAESNPHMLDALREIADRFNASVYVVTVSKDSVREAFALLNRPYRVMKMIRSTDPLFESISSRDVDDGLMQFIDNYHIDMMGLIPHDHPVVEKVYKKSVSKDIIYQSHIPLLILPELTTAAARSIAVEREIIL